MKILLLIAALATLGGCASSYTEPTLPADHPASAAAPPALPMERSRMLDIAASELAPAAPAEKPMDHAGHGMGEAPKSEASPTPTPGAAVMYACPMHPEVTSDKPDQRCPKCNMKLKPVAKSGGTR
ncbi:MAG: heavy metal-binding domain-containing protein [Phycisphaerales bacterium]